MKHNFRRIVTAILKKLQPKKALKCNYEGGQYKDIVLKDRKESTTSKHSPLNNLFRNRMSMQNEKLLKFSSNNQTFQALWEMAI